MARILFRADGNSQIGAGHIMRCVSIALAAMEEGHECLFCQADSYFEDILTSNGIPVKILGTHYEKMDEEWSVLDPLLRTFSPDIIVVDSYFVTKEYLIHMGNFADVTYIDDVLALPYPVKKIVNYNLFASEEGYNNIYKNLPIPELIIGGEFAPLRKEFQNINSRTTAKTVKKILISAGGADVERILIRFVREIQKTEVTELEYHLLAGSFEPDIYEIQGIAAERTDIFIHQNISNVSELMQMCDVAISAAGSTLYELCACGVPTITYVLADNQEAGARIMAQKQIMINGGDYREKPNLCEEIFDILRSLIADYELRKAMSQREVSFIDGKGAARLVEEILK